jgi:hypothetical protein
MGESVSARGFGERHELCELGERALWKVNPAEAIHAAANITEAGRACRPA